MHVLVVDDEPAVRDSLARSLRFEGYEVSLAADGDQALSQIAQTPPDVVILDVLMPNLDGLATCRRLRAQGNRVPVLMLTARDGVADRVVGLDAGADDYLVKPFALEELLARLRALLRRSAPDEEDPRLIFEDLSLDPVTREVSRGSRPISLTVTEFNLLEMLLEHPRQVLTRAQIVQRVWGFALEYSSNSLEVYVGYLRRKLESEGESRLIHTVRGIGYVLRETPP